MVTEAEPPHNTSSLHAIPTLFFVPQVVHFLILKSLASLSWQPPWDLLGRIKFALLSPRWHLAQEYSTYSHVDSACTHVLHLGTEIIQKMADCLLSTKHGNIFGTQSVNKHQDVCLLGFFVLFFYCQVFSLVFICFVVLETEPSKLKSKHLFRYLLSNHQVSVTGAAEMNKTF